MVLVNQGTFEFSHLEEQVESDYNLFSDIIGEL